MKLYKNFIWTIWVIYIVHIVAWSEFARNIVEFNIDWSICDWKILNYTEVYWSIFDKIYQSLLNGHYGSNCIVPDNNFFKNISSSKKELSVEIYVESLKGQSISICILSWSEFAICAFDKNWCFLNGWYRSNHIVCDSNILKTCETEKKTWAFHENLIQSLKRKITVKPCCAWYNFSITF